MDRLLCSSLLIVLGAAVIEAASWNYDAASKYGPNNWNTMYSDYCDPSKYPRQSPINILKGMLRYDRTLGKMEHDNFDTDDVIFQAHNNGHTVQFNIGGDVKTDGGPVDVVDYYALQLHFHWGDSNPYDGHGSEHTILGQQHKAEMHIVHVNHKHIGLEVKDVVKKEDGLLVLGVFIDIADPANGKYPNSEFYKIIEGTKMVKDKANTKYNMTEGYMNLGKLLPEKQEHYYTYPGGLTTPNCHGAVTWVVYKEPIYITKEQLEVFFSVKDENGNNLTNIYRPPQPVNGRLVRTTNPEDGMIVSSSNNIQGHFAFILATFLISLFM